MRLWYQPRPIRLGLALATLTILVTVSLTPAEDIAPRGWPLFRGNPEQTGVTAAALPDPVEVLWQFPTQDSVESTAAIAGGVVYIGSFDQNLYAIDLATGKEKWRYKAGPFKAPASLRGDAVYVGDADGMFHCIDAATGKKRWTFETEAEITSGANFAGDKVLFGSYDENLYCLSKEGKKVWNFKINGPVNGSPAIAANRTFVAGCDSALHVIDTNTGKELSSVDLGGQAAATAAVAGDQLYVGTMTNEVLAIDWKKPEVVWRYEAARRQQPFYGSAAVTDTLVIAPSRDKLVHAIDRKTGRPVWAFPTEGRVDGSPVVVGQRVYVGSSDAHLYVLDLAKGKLIQKIKLDGATVSSPAVAGSRLVIGTNKGTVYCLGAKN